MVSSRGASGSGSTFSKLIFASLGIVLAASLSTVLSNYDAIIKPMAPSQNNPVSKDPGQYAPFSCPSLMQRIRNNTAANTEVNDPNSGIVFARQTATNPKFWISVHNQSFDKTRWGLMTHGIYYERKLTEAFTQVLLALPPPSKRNAQAPRVIDVGGNIGFFSLLSAAIRPIRVDAFEPNKKNVLRFCESLSLNHWYGEYETPCRTTPFENSYVNLYAMGVGKNDGYMQFREGNNPGLGRFVDAASAAPSKADRLRIVALDSFARDRGWFQTQPDIAILKVDVEGLELDVFKGASSLLKAKLVRNIFMELNARNQKEQDEALEIAKLLVGSGYRVRKYGGWMGPHFEANSLPANDDAALPAAVVNLALQDKVKKANLWWAL